MPCGIDPTLRHLRTLQIRVDYENNARAVEFAPGTDRTLQS